MNSYTNHLAVFERVHRLHAERLLQEFQLDCVTGDWLDSAVLKLQKRNWSDHGAKEGIFFSGWLGSKDIEKGRFNYNIHALRLGRQQCCGVKPVAFARAFRSRFEPTGWPNVSTQHGPQTLMQGWMPLDPDAFEKNVVALLDRFVSMHKLIDELLNEGSGA